MFPDTDDTIHREMITEKGKKVEELDVEIGNKKKKVRTSVEVSERQYSAEKEVQELFSKDHQGKWTG